MLTHYFCSGHRKWNTLAFRGRLISLLAPARGMPALRPRQEVFKRWPQRLYLACLPLKLGGFSRPSSLLLTVGSQGSWDCTIVRPTEDLLLFPQDKESSGSVTSHEENGSVFSRSRRLSFQSTR